MMDERGLAHDLARRWGLDRRRQADTRFTSVLAFAREINHRHTRTLGANALAFAEARSKARFAARMSDRRVGLWIYRLPGEAHRSVFQTWLVRACLSLSLNILKQDLRIWVAQAPAARFVAWIERAAAQAGPPTVHDWPSGEPGAANAAPTGRRGVAKPLLPSTMLSWLGTRPAAGSHEEAPSYAFGRRGDAAFYALAVHLSPVSVRQAVRYAQGTASSRSAGGLDGRAVERPGSHASVAAAGDTRRVLREAERIAATLSERPFFRPDAQPRRRPPGDEDRPVRVVRARPHPIFDSVGERDRPWAGAPSQARAFVRMWGERAGLADRSGTGAAPISGPGGRRREPSSPPGDRTALGMRVAVREELAQVGDMRYALMPRPVSDRARRGVPQKSFAPGDRLRSGVDVFRLGVERWAGSMFSGAAPDDRPTATHPSLAEMLIFLESHRGIATALASREMAGGGEISAGDHTSADGETPTGRPALTVLRQAVVAPPAPMSYVYTQPPRAAADETRTIRTAEVQEVTAIVRQEVAQLMAGEPVMARFSRGDYVQIADQVYSVLARRLTVEAERVGWR